jgi:hypothetical protein
MYTRTDTSQSDLYEVPYARGVGPIFSIGPTPSAHTYLWLRLDLSG